MLADSPCLEVQIWAYVESAQAPELASQRVVRLALTGDKAVGLWPINLTAPADEQPHAKLTGATKLSQEFQSPFPAQVHVVLDYICRQPNSITKLLLSKVQAHGQLVLAERLSLKISAKSLLSSLLASNSNLGQMHS
ncbi:unnamed protein product [Effrenium voratum]|uniref:Uncharacterized protein n=1 Tax=Effrenium voratum TaxID=2562239 RepID=A0AA36N3B0_9DINO|nr:unnamed protein product [Effrenium voratum]CAJ1434167.1 unnamed protein product [Effrenium voratum]